MGSEFPRASHAGAGADELPAARPPVTGAAPPSVALGGASRRAVQRAWLGGLIAGYVAIMLAPVALAFLDGRKTRPFLDDLSSALAMTGFAMLLLEFVLSGRFRAVSGAIGIDVTMRFHQLIARGLTVFLVVHPFLYTLPMGGGVPWDTEGALSLSFPLAGAVSGFVAWGALLAVVGLALFRDSAGLRYETWRLSHGLGAALIAVAGLHHTLALGRYSDAPLLAGFWAAAAAAALASLAVVYIVRPLRQRANPYRVSTVTRCAERMWCLAIEPAPGSRALKFRAGQFAWLKFVRPLFRITEHPFSICSSPAELPRLAFLIKEAGDFTGAIGDIEAGASVYVDGPHGNFTLQGRPAAGFVFIAGGVGFAPILALLRECRAAGERRPIILIYGNRHEGQIAFRDELAALERELDLRIVHVLSEPPSDWRGLRGQLDADTLARCLPRDPARGWLYFVCGPTAMADSVEDALTRAGVPLSRIVSERFRYDAGRATRREKMLLAGCAAIVVAAVLGALAFALR